MSQVHVFGQFRASKQTRIKALPASKSSERIIDNTNEIFLDFASRRRSSRSEISSIVRL